jgi:hypothetical protein
MPLHYSDCKLAARSTFTKHSIIIEKTGSFIAIIGIGFKATIAALPCTIGPFTCSSTTNLTSVTTMENNLYTSVTTMENNLYAALFSFAFVIPKILDLRGQGEYRQG